MPAMKSMKAMPMEAMKTIAEAKSSPNTADKRAAAAKKYQQLNVQKCKGDVDLDRKIEESLKEKFKNKLTVIT